MKTATSAFHRRPWEILLFLASTTIIGCDGPTAPSRQLLSLSVAHTSGSTLTVPSQYPYNTIGGVVLPPGSGVLSVTVVAGVGRAVPWAQLNVYLLTEGTTDKYCGQNTPDSPTWQDLEPGWKTSVTVTGFQVYRLPCDVTGIRAMLHTRRNGLRIPPSASETIVEGTMPTLLHLVR